MRPYLRKTSWPIWMSAPVNTTVPVTSVACSGILVRLLGVRVGSLVRHFAHSVEESRRGSCRDAIVLLVRLDVDEAHQVPKLRRRVLQQCLPQFGVQTVDLGVLRNEANQEHDNQYDG